MIERIIKISGYWNAVIMATASSFILIGMLLVVSDSAGRYFFHNPITGATEINQILLAYIGYPAFVYALYTNQHVRVTLLFNRFPEHVRPALEIFIAIVGIVLCTFLLIGSWEQFWDSWVIKETMPTVLPIPFWLPKFIMPVGMFFFAIQFVIVIIIQVNIMLAQRRKS